MTVKYDKYKDVKSGLYIIRNVVNGKFYVGSTDNNKRRWYNHRYKLNKGNHDNLYLQRAWNKYGESSFLFELIYEISPKQAILLEDIWLERWFGTEQCYNLNKSAQMPGLGQMWSEERKQKISKKLKGRKYTPEQIEKYRQGTKKRFDNMTSEERKITCQHLRNISEESEKIRREKISKSSKKMWKKRTKKQLEKIGKSISKGKKNSGYTHSEETRKKFSEALKGKPWSETRRFAQLNKNK